MKARHLVVLLAAFLVLPAVVFARGDVHVHGYYRSDGTYVQPYYRSAPDHSYNNNWSTSPNINPYTGRQGTRQPTWNDRPPQRSNPYGTLGTDPYGTSHRRSRQSNPWRY